MEQALKTPDAKIAVPYRTSMLLFLGMPVRVVPPSWIVTTPDCRSTKIAAYFLP